MLGMDLERLFRTQGQIAVLRVLWRSPAPLTGRQVQQLAGVHNLTAMQCLDNLEDLGLLQRRAAGRAYLYSLKRRNRLVRYLIDPVFKAEAAAPGRLTRELGKTLNDHCLSAVLYGSVARGKADRAGDVDVLIVVEDEAAAQRFAASAQARAEKLVRDGWSLMLEVNLKTRKELARQWSSPLLKRIRREGQVVAGAPLEEVGRGRG